MSDVKVVTREGPPWEPSEAPGPAAESGEQASPDEALEALRAVYDPEIGINIVDLGLVYNVKMAHDGQTDVIMTLTSPACPLGPVIIDQVSYVVGRLPGVENVNVEFVWTPTWDPRVMCTEEAKAELGIW